MTSSRKTGIALGLLALVVLSGCSAFTPEPDQERLGEDATYDWNRSADATYDVQPDEYTAIVGVENTSEITLWRPGDLGGQEPLEVSAMKFRYPNGTVVGASAFEFERTREELIVTLPASEGAFAYTAESGSRSVFVPITGTGTHEVILPPGMRTDVPVFGDVDPAGYEQTRTDTRVHITWTDAPENPIYVQYYLQRDLYIFGGAVAVFAVLGTIGLLYFRVQIKNLERRREEDGLDLERD